MKEPSERIGELAEESWFKRQTSDSGMPAEPKIEDWVNGIIDYLDERTNERTRNQRTS